MATIKDVANRAEVSTATVSHVINKTKFVSQEVRDKVLNAIEETGYIPNNIARSLKVNQTKTIGLIVAYIENPIYSGVFREIEKYARNHGYSVLICNSNDDPDIEEEQIQLLLTNRVDGLIIVPSKNSKIPKKGLIPEGFPVCFLNRQLSGYSVPSVVIENKQASYEAVNHLIQKHNQKEVGIILGERHNQLSKERHEGYRLALLENSIEYNDDLVIEGYSTFQGGVSAVRDLASEGYFPDSVFITGTTMMLGFMFELKKMGISCPADISIIGFSDTNMSPLMDPPLSAVAQPINKLAERSVELLFEQIDGAKKGDLVEVLSCKVNYRMSCGCHWEPKFSQSNYDKFYESVYSE
ncbi:LacI family DNA-binding transcriptional regulator [Alkalibacillus aidingensis]|uniref:LacI family DNA-binding transcriptional regulator n=1 Tax=Alkalibacillus aidingensis TaxID=2747607 RepID=UPI001660E8AB|nr:LacI family DNA-binding transcriptional regulator [Alkalibacillus aidingensis]